ncbi:MAG: hypothetical protein NWF07_10525 [Candidatus Bathyarchaeota archaeon]|nr:hypothetical protein [Candidatus Bathyarchaeota archaeon]
MLNIHKKITDKKKAINILILGPYGKCLTRLLRLRDHLRTRGYENTKLVKDFTDDDQRHKDADIYFLEKSKDYIKNWADILLFVFDQECNNDSVLIELCYMIENINEKSSHSAIISSSERYIGSLLRGTIKLNHIRFREFSTIDELEKKGYSAAFNITKEIEATRWYFPP